MMTHNGELMRLRWPVVVWSSDQSVSHDELLRATTWWEQRIEHHLGCADGEGYVLCMRNVQLFYVLNPGVCVDDQPVVLSGDGAWVDVRRYSHEVTPTHGGQARSTWDRELCPIDSEVEVNPRLDSRLFDLVLAHELGHVAGLAHDGQTSYKPSIMVPKIIAAEHHLTEHDAWLIAGQIEDESFCRN
jgi:hypothetical protein